MRFDIADLHLFLCVVDAGSITQGAVRANLALASASERLRHIESDAGVPLLERHSRGVLPTEAGEALLHHARLILRQQAVLKEELHDFAAGARGTLHLYANTGALSGFLDKHLAPWLAERPRLHIRLKERTSAEIVRLIAAGLAEAGIVSDAVKADALLAGLTLHPVAKDHLVLIVPAAHHLASRKPVQLQEVLDEPFVGLLAGNALQDHIEEKARTANPSQRRSLVWRIRMKTFEGLCEMVSHGVGVGIVPQAVAARHRRGRRYQIVPLLDDWASRHLCLCYRDWRALPATTRSLLSHLGEGDAGHELREPKP